MMTGWVRDRCATIEVKQGVMGDLFEDRGEKGVIWLGAQVQRGDHRGLLLQAVAAQLIGSLIQPLLLFKQCPRLQHQIHQDQHQKQQACWKLKSHYANSGLYASGSPYMDPDGYAYPYYYPYRKPGHSYALQNTEITLPIQHLHS